MENQSERGERVIEAIFGAVEEINQQLPEERRLEKSVDTVISGEAGKLDSLGLINLIVATEQKIEEEFDVGITLTDEKTMSQEKSPFKTIETLVVYISSVLEEKLDG